MIRISHWVTAGIVGTNQNKTLIEMYEMILTDLKTTSFELGYGSRKREFIDKRTVVLYLLHRVVGFKSAEVGKLLKCDHATVLHHCHKCSNLMQFSPQFKYVIDLENKYRLYKIKKS